MIELTVALGERSYPILIGRGLLADCEPLQRLAAGRQVAIVTDTNVATLHGPAIRQLLAPHAAALIEVVMPAGEAHKTFDSLNLIFDALLESRFDRGALLVAVGGGVVGDMAGFAAAVYQRGIDFVQVPTTLLAQVDSSVGGKTGINHPLGKNMIGAFHQPRLVLIDPATLGTLPEREFRAGMAEVIKYGVIGDAELFADLEAAAGRDAATGLASLSAVGPALLQTLLERSAAAKARVVAADEREGGLRAILNYGHTLGHVVEALCGYGTWLHGEAVAIGMVAAGELALELGLWSQVEQSRQRAVIAAAGLPQAWPQLEPEAVLRCLQGDKKVRDGRVRFVLPTGLGRVEICDEVSGAQVLAALERCR